MSDEEDTAILLGGEQTCTEKEIKINPTQETYQDVNQNKSSAKIQLILSSVALISSGICFGYDLGIVGNLIKPVSYTFSLNCIEEYYVIGIWLIGAFLSGLTGGLIIDMCGRKWGIVCASIVLIFSSTFPNIIHSFSFFLCSRFLSGYAGPLLTISQSVYTSETSGPKFRGFRISLHHLGASFGTLLSCIAPLYIDSESKHWRIALLLNIIPAFIALIITSLSLPISPHFKLYQRVTKVSKRLTNLSPNIMAEIGTITGFLIVIQQFCGRYVIFFYAPRLFSLLGICASQAVSIAMITFAVVKFLSTFLCMCILDRLGRRTSLIMSSTIMMISLAFLALLSSFDESVHTFKYLRHADCHRIAMPETANFLAIPYTKMWYYHSTNTPLALPKSPPPFPMLPTPLSLISPNLDNCPDIETTTTTLMPALRVIAVVTSLIYEAAFALGFGTVTWVVLCELFPASVRGQSVSGIVAIHWVAEFFGSVFYIKFTDYDISIGSTFLVASFICLLSILTTFFMMPETKGKTLHQIAQDLRHIPLSTRIFQNLHALPFFTNVQWIEQRANKYRQQKRHVVESTII